MPTSPMRRQDKEIKDPAAVRAILAEALCCRVGMVDGERPYVIPVSFVLDGDALYVHSADHGRKLRVLRKNPHVCFEVDSGVEVAIAQSVCDVGMRFRSVVGFGTVSFVEVRPRRRASCGSSSTSTRRRSSARCPSARSPRRWSGVSRSAA